MLIVSDKEAYTTAPIPIISPASVAYQLIVVAETPRSAAIAGEINLNELSIVNAKTKKNKMAGTAFFTRL